MIAALRRHKWLVVLALVVFFGMAFVVAAILSSLGSAPGSASVNWKAVGLLAAFFASLGALYGSVAALDSRSGMSVGNHPVWRMLLGAIFGAATVFIVWSWNPANFDNTWSLVGAAVGGVLGWFGWRWARYVDF